MTGNYAKHAIAKAARMRRTMSAGVSLFRRYPPVSMERSYEADAATRSVALCGLLRGYV